MGGYTCDDFFEYACSDLEEGGATTMVATATVAAFAAVVEGRVRATGVVAAAAVMSVQTRAVASRCSLSLCLQRLPLCSTLLAGAAALRAA